MSRLKVYGVGDRYSGRRVVAARNRAEAVRLLGITRRTLAMFGRVSDIEDEVAAAMADPGVVMATVWLDGARRVGAEGPFKPEPPR